MGILAPWATLVSKVQRATQAIGDAGGIPGPQDPHVPLARKESSIVSKCPRKILLMIEERKKTVYSAMYSTYSQYYKSSFITLQPSIQCVRNRKRETKNRKQKNYVVGSPVP